MQTARVLAGFSLGEADILRRAMSKKDQKVIDQEKSKFINGAVKNGRTVQVATRVYDYIEQFANYGFNRSHAVAYTMIAFWLAYLQVHYPAEFYASMLNSNIGNQNKANEYIMRAQEDGVKILPPDINKSDLAYQVIDGRILVGLRAIKGVRIDFLKEIIAKRQAKSFDSLSNFLRQIDVKFIKANSITNVVESLIKSGCFDQLNKNRNELLQNCPEIIENVKLTGENLALSEGLGGVPIKPAKEPSKQEMALMEEKTLGFSTLTSPLITVQKYAQKFNAKSLNEFQIHEDGIAVGKLMSLKLVRTKKGQTMAFGSFADTTNKQDIVIFPNVYDKIQSNLNFNERWRCSWHECSC